MIEVIRTKRAAANKALAWGLLLVAMILLFMAAKPAHAKTFTVNYTGDGPDAVPGNGVCNVVFGLCSLRAAIQETSAFAGADTINFNIPDNPNIPGLEVKTIKPNSELPAIFDPVTINGYTQNGASPNTLAQGNNAVLKIELDGTNAGAQLGLNGLKLNASGSIIKGLAINRFKGTAIEIGFSGGNVTGNKIEGNFIGTDPSGTLDRGNIGGVEIVGGSGSNSNNTVGGATPDKRNVISGNNNGIVIGSPGNKVLGNYIGTKKNGTGALGNTFDGVGIVNSSGNTIGGASPASANTIAFNGTDGVLIAEITVNTTGNRILRNSIFSNGEQGIDLGSDGKTPNDGPGDPDTGPNQLQNYPVFTSATTSGGTTTIKGSLNSTPNKTFTLRFFSNPSGNEGKKFIGSKSVTTNANGNTGIFTFTPNQVVPVGERITATATDPGGNTSEFSLGKQVL